jgi:hypothetical protein
MADLTLELKCPKTSLAPVLAILTLVAAVSTPLERVKKESRPGRDA